MVQHFKSFKPQVTKCELARDDEVDDGLNLPQGHGRLLVVLHESRSFLGEFLEDFVDEAIHYIPTLLGDTYVKDLL